MAVAWIRGYRVVFALMTLVAIAYQFYQSPIKKDFSPVSFFSFFTIQANLFAALVFIYLAYLTLKAREDETHAPGFEMIRGASALYMTTTFVVYGLLLSGYQEELQTTVPWVDTALHRVMPLVVMADWIIDPPRRRIELRPALIWLAYPLIYCAYSLIRGPVVDWYPYPFLDPRSPGSYGVVALYSVAIAIAAAVFTWLIVAGGNRVRLAVSPGT